METTKIIMGMPIIISIINATEADMDAVFDYFHTVDARFSTYKQESEMMRINRSELSLDECSIEMKEVLSLANETQKETGGYFSITRPDGMIDPSGIVKGWAIRNAAKFVEEWGYDNYFLNVGGDIQSKGFDSNGDVWTVGIRNPFKLNEIIKVVYPHGNGVATSGNYIRGDHIYNPHLMDDKELCDIVSLTVVAPDVYEADRFATAAFAMGKKGILFIENLEGFEGYMIDAKGIATMTTGFEKMTHD